MIVPDPAARTGGPLPDLLFPPPPGGISEVKLLVFSILVDAVDSKFVLPKDLRAEFFCGKELRLPNRRRSLTGTSPAMPRGCLLWQNTLYFYCAPFRGKRGKGKAIGKLVLLPGPRVVSGGGGQGYRDEGFYPALTS